MVNSVDPDQTPHIAASDLGLHCLLRHVCQNIYNVRDISGNPTIEITDKHDKPLEISEFNFYQSIG